MTRWIPPILAGLVATALLYFLPRFLAPDAPQWHPTWVLALACFILVSFILWPIGRGVVEGMREARSRPTP